MVFGDGGLDESRAWLQVSLDDLLPQRYLNGLGCGETVCVMTGWRCHDATVAETLNDLLK